MSKDDELRPKFFFEKDDVFERMDERSIGELERIMRDKRYPKVIRGYAYHRLLLLLLEIYFYRKRYAGSLRDLEKRIINMLSIRRHFTVEFDEELRKRVKKELKK